MLHQLRHRVLAISDPLLELGRNQGSRFGLVELQSSSETLLS